MKEHVTRLRVRYSEVDRQDAVYHACYFAWFDIGRTEFLRHLGIAYKDLEDQGFLLVVTRASIRYIKPARLDDEIRLVTRLTKRTRIRLFFEYEVYRENDGTLLTMGKTELACISRQGKATKLPGYVAEKLERHGNKAGT